MSCATPQTPVNPDDVAVRLQTDTVRDGGALILQARGEVDAYTLPNWRRIVEETAVNASAAESVIVDITGLDFVACSALATLANQAEMCRKQGNDLAVVSCSPIVQRVAAVTGLDARLAIYPTADAAVRATRG